MLLLILALVALRSVLGIRAGFEETRSVEKAMRFLFSIILGLWVIVLSL